MEEAELILLGDPRRRKSEALAWAAEQACARGQTPESDWLFARAAELEEAVAAAVPASMPRLRGVLAISACALWSKAHAADRQRNCAATFLANTDGMPEAAVAKLHALMVASQP